MLYLEISQFGRAEDKKLPLVVNMMVSIDEPQAAFSFVKSIINNLKPEEKIAAFTDLLRSLIARNHVNISIIKVFTIFDASLDPIDQEMLASVLQKLDIRYYILYLIHKNKLELASKVYESYLTKSKKVDLIEVLLHGRNNALPDLFKFIEANPDYGRLIPDDLDQANVQYSESNRINKEA